MAEKIKPIAIHLRGKLAAAVQAAADRDGVKVQKWVEIVLEGMADIETPPKPKRSDRRTPRQLPSDRGRPPHPDCSCTTICRLARGESK